MTWTIKGKRRPPYTHRKFKKLQVISFILMETSRMSFILCLLCYGHISGSNYWTGGGGGEGVHEHWADMRFVFHGNWRKLSRFFITRYNGQRRSSPWHGHVCRAMMETHTQRHTRWKESKKMRHSRTEGKNQRKRGKELTFLLQVARYSSKNR